MAHAFLSIATANENALDFTQPPLEASHVFEWWDDGIITPEEAEEIFSRLEEGNYAEACLLAEVYAQEPCTTTNPSQSKKRKNAQEAPTIVPHGRLSWKSQYDSDGHLKKHREELQLQFYYFKLRLGSQELLSYRRDGFEADFGQISTLEFHSHVPLDTLWGTMILYPIGKFKLRAFLDTAKTFHVHASFKPNRENEFAATFWKFTDANVIALQTRTALGQISTWYQFGQAHPLIKIQLQSDKKRLSWKTTAYLHGVSFPRGINLSKGIAENWLWASQTLTLKWPETQNTVISAKARVLSPIATDTISARFKMSLASGPARLRPSLSATCIEAHENCSQTEWKGAIESAWEPYSFSIGARYRHTSNSKPPKIEFGTSYRPSRRALAQLTLALPETNPAKGISVQNEIHLDNEWLGCELVFAFKKTKKQPFRPNFAHIQAEVKF